MPEEGIEVAKRYECVAYVECSAKPGQGVKHVFDTCIAAALLPEPKSSNNNKKTCSLQ